MRLPYVNHGHRHGPFGSDPVSGLATVSEITSVDQSVVVTNPDGPSVDLAVNILQSWAYDTAITIPPSGGGGGTLVDWNNNPGGSMLDFATINTPQFNFSGLVIMTVTVESAKTGGDPVWTPGTQLFADLQTPAPTGAFPQGTTLVVYSDVDATTYPEAINACAGELATINDGLQLVIGNTDSIDHLVNWLVKLQQIVGA